MAQITAAMVKQLREMTDSPMMECKKALVEADGDMDAAVDVLRKNGLAKAAKKAGRETNEGAVAAFVSEDGKTGALLELSCETDFVGSNAKFTGFASKVAEVVATTEPADVDALLEKPMGEETVSSELTEMIHIMGENMKISRFAARKAENGALASYIHMGGKIGVLVEFAFEKAETAQAESFKTFAHDVAFRLPLSPRSALPAIRFRPRPSSTRSRSTWLRLPSPASPRPFRRRWLSAVWRSSTSSPCSPSRSSSRTAPSPSRSTQSRSPRSSATPLPSLPLTVWSVASK